MKKKRILKEPIRYSKLFSKVLSINLAIRVMLNQRPSAATKQMRPSEELCPKSNWSLTNALRNHSDKQGVDELNSIIYQNTLEMMHVQGETAHKKDLCKGGKNAKCFSKLLLCLKATINCTRCCTGSNLSSCRRPCPWDSGCYRPLHHCSKPRAARKQLLEAQVPEPDQSHTMTWA